MKNKEKISPKQNGFRNSIIFPAIIGVFTGILIFIFKISASFVMSVSKSIYSFVSANPAYLPLLLIGAAVLGLISALALKYAKECRGGGIPTAIASIRGLVPLKWMQGILVLFSTSMITYFAGVPLGNEGPSVQMGTAVGKGASETLGTKKRAWDRYLMTSGACSGFAIATGAPLTGIMFALEETHRRFSPALLTVAAVSVLSGTVTHEILSAFFGIDTTFFDLTIDAVLPIRHLWVAVVVGAICGIVSIVFTQIYRFARALQVTVLKNISFVLKISVIFVASALLGFISLDFIGTGHDLIERILHSETVWYLLFSVLAVRALVMIFANVQGVSGGLFVPTLAFGAIIAALVAEALISIGVIEEQYFSMLIVVGMASFLAASSRTPITALTFAAEALCLANNILPTVIGVTVAYLTVERFGRTSFTDAVIESKIEHAHHGKEPIIVDTHMTVMSGAFADGMNVRDILWPPTCVVLSIDKKQISAKHDPTVIGVGDVLHLHYQTYDEGDTLEILTHILGSQESDKNAKIKYVNSDHITPLE